VVLGNRDLGGVLGGAGESWQRPVHTGATKVMFARGGWGEREPEADEVVRQSVVSNSHKEPGIRE